METIYVVSKKRGLDRSGFKKLTHYKIFDYKPNGLEDYFTDPERDYRLFEYKAEIKEGERAGSNFTVDIPSNRVEFSDVHLPIGYDP